MDIRGGRHKISPLFSVRLNFVFFDYVTEEYFSSRDLVISD